MSALRLEGSSSNESSAFPLSSALCHLSAPHPTCGCWHTRWCLEEQGCGLTFQPKQSGQIGSNKAAKLNMAPREATALLQSCYLQSLLPERRARDGGKKSWLITVTQLNMWCCEHVAWIYRGVAMTVSERARTVWHGHIAVCHMLLAQRGLLPLWYLSKGLS